ncbi:MAG: hypothetical protein PVH75_07820 [Syntrophobacterales bacterium]
MAPTRTYGDAIRPFTNVNYFYHRVIPRLDYGQTIITCVDYINILSTGMCRQTFRPHAHMNSRNDFVT